MVVHSLFISYDRTVGGEIRVGLFALRDIAPGTELTYDYRFEAYGDMKKCLCGSDKCRGFIGVNKKLEVKPVGNDSLNLCVSQAKASQRKGKGKESGSESWT
jgi:hypothetical protein